LELTAGAQFGPYEIVAPIGSGGMGQVWRAHDSRLKRDVAIKFLAPHLARDEQIRRRFDAEATAVAQLAHPNICRIYDVGDAYLVMELLAGETLADRLARGPLSIEETVRIGAEIATALAAAHERGIVHRDLKPGNVMLTSQGAKLLDFGLAKTSSSAAERADAPTQPATPLTREGTVVGTLQYMAPEQLEGDDVDARTDIFSLGVVLFEMLAGKHPFRRSTPEATVAALLGQSWPALQKFRTDVPPFLERIVRRCVQREPSQRWQSAADLAEMLRWVDPDATSEPLDATPPRRFRRAAWLVAAAVVLLGIAAIPMLMRRGERAVPSGPPLVMLVDSTLPERVYSSESGANGATNADDLTDVLRDLPVTLVKENTNALWSREDQVLNENPALIISHRSAFAAPEAGLTEPELAAMFALSERRVQSFLGYVGLGNPRTKFIIYSRNWDGVGGEQTWIHRVVARYPHLKGRLATILVTGATEPSFRDPASASRIRQAVIRQLELE
jgi:serine/threonine protein kinase